MLGIELGTKDLQNNPLTTRLHKLVIDRWCSSPTETMLLLFCFLTIMVGRSFLIFSLRRIRHKYHKVYRIDTKLTTTQKGAKNTRASTEKWYIKKLSLAVQLFWWAYEIGCTLCRAIRLSVLLSSSLLSLLLAPFFPPFFQKSNTRKSVQNSERTFKGYPSTSMHVNLSLTFWIKLSTDVVYSPSEIRQNILYFLVKNLLVYMHWSYKNL